MILGVILRSVGIGTIGTKTPTLYLKLLKIDEPKGLP
jgi:hypothetical protein